jgi:hypothetical protein
VLSTPDAAPAGRGSPSRRKRVKLMGEVLGQKVSVEF